VKAALIIAAVAALVCAAAATASRPEPPRALEAYATARSYAPGDVARIELLGDTRGVSVTVHRAGDERSNAMPSHEMLGGPAVPVTATIGRHEIRLGVGTWPSGLYFARIVGPAGHCYAPFIVRPKRLGEHRIAVVLPTNTWQAYNFRDANRDGVGDTWYADPRLTVSLDRPFMINGSPPHYAQYDLLFLRWLARTHKQVDFLSDDDLESLATGGLLARAYDLVVFSGHHEYVTAHEYDVVERYRDLGGNLLFLSANNFFYKVVRTGETLHRVGRWRDLGRPEAALVGIQYLDWNHETYGNGPYVVQTAGWPFTGTGLHPGSRFGTYGIEIDGKVAASPRDLQILATIPNLFGHGKTASMAYYTTPAGAKVFAAGTINFGGTALWSPVPTILGNIWSRLAQP
jgi:N,N-dimethylformamidase